MVEQPSNDRPVAGSIPALECKDASAVESESGLIPGCFGTIRASLAPQGWGRSVGIARWSNTPLLPARQTEDECREDQSQTGIATSIKRQPRRFTRLRLRPGRVETSGSCVRQGTANPTKEPARELYSQVSDLFYRSLPGLHPREHERRFHCALWIRQTKKPRPAGHRVGHHFVRIDNDWRRQRGAPIGQSQVG